MALTAEVLKQQEVLKTLTADQLTAITTLSKNDETTVIGREMGTILGGIDAVVLELTGKPKPHGTKTIDFVKSELTVLKTAGDNTELTAQIEKLKGEKTTLEQQIKAGTGDAALKGKVTELEQQLTDKTNSITELQSKLEADKTDYQKQIEAEKANLVGLKVDNEFNQALTGLKFKSEDVIPKAVRDSFVSNAKNGLLSEYKPDWIDNGQGGKRMVFRNKEGVIANNPNNNLQPYTAGELLQTKVKDILDTGRQQGGAGTGGQGSGAGKDAITISGARTKTELTTAIQKELATQGIAANDPKYQEKFNTAYKKNLNPDMPLR